MAADGGSKRHQTTKTRLNLKDISNSNTCGAGEIVGEGWGSCDVGSHVSEWSINSKREVIRLSGIPYHLKNCHLREDGTETALLYTYWMVPSLVRYGYLVWRLTTALADESSITLVARERSDLVTSMAWPPEALAKSRYSWASNWLIERGLDLPWGFLRRRRLARTSVSMKVT